MKIEIFTVINALESFGFIVYFDSKKDIVEIGKDSSNMGLYVPNSDTLEFGTVYKHHFSFLNDNIIKRYGSICLVEGFSGPAFDLISDPILIDFIKKNKDEN